MAGLLALARGLFALALLMWPRALVFAIALLTWPRALMFALALLAQAPATINLLYRH